MRTNVFAAAFPRADITCLQQSRLHKKKQYYPSLNIHTHYSFENVTFQTIFSLLKTISEKNGKWTFCPIPSQVHQFEREIYFKFSSMKTPVLFWTKESDAIQREQTKT